VVLCAFAMFSSAMWRLMCGMRSDAVMMADLGGPLSPEGIEDKVRRDVAAASADTSWIKMIIPGDDAAQVAGSVALWRHDAGTGMISEIGWMVLPDFSGAGWASTLCRPCWKQPAMTASCGAPLPAPSRPTSGKGSRASAWPGQIRCRPRG